MNPQDNQNPQNTVSASEPTASLSPKHNTLMAILAYIGPLVIVSYLTAKDDSFVKFHIKQGLVLFVLEVIVWILGMLIWGIWPLIQILHLALFIWSIIGIVNAVQGKEKSLPITGKYADRFKV